MLKDILRLLLSKFYSKKESELVGHQATPSNSFVNFTLSKTEVTSTGLTEEVLNTISPSDGFLFVSGTSLSQGHRLLLNTRAGLYLNAYGNGITAQGTVVVYKGEHISVSACAMTNLRARLYKFVGSASIGGGYQALKRIILQGGGLCLSHWYSSLQRNSYRTSGSGWLISQQFLFKALLNYLLLQMEKVTHSRCRTRGLSTSEVMEFGLPILEGSISSISDHLRMGIFRSGLTLKKVKNLPTQLGNQISSLLPIFEYTKSRGTIDQMFGGASC